MDCSTAVDEQAALLRNQFCSIFVLNMGRRKLDAINQYLKEGYDLRVVCMACGHAAVLDALSVSMRCRTVKDRQMEVIERKLKCANCGVRNALFGPVER